MVTNQQALMIRIAADTRQANEVLRRISDHLRLVGDSASRAADSTENLKKKVADMGHAGGALYLVSQAFQAVGVSISGAVKAADGWAVISARMRIAAGDAHDFAAVQARVFDIAQSAGAKFEDIGDIYAKVTKGGEQLGLTQERVIGVTQTVANTLRMMGGSSASASAALAQFGQALSSGELRGEELNSILEQMPPLAEAIAKGLGKPVGALRALAADGKLSVNQLVLALESSALDVERKAAQMPRTFSGSMAVLGNEVQRFVAQINESAGASGAFNAVITALSNNMHAAATIFGGILAVAIGKAAGAALAAAQTKLALAAATRAAAIEQARLAVQAAAARVAMTGNVASLVAAQAALNRLTGAAASARTALAFVGGPIGAITSLLTIGAGAWVIWGNNAKSAAEQAKEAAQQNEQAAERIIEEQKRGAKYGIGNEGVLNERKAELTKRIAGMKDTTTYRSGSRKSAPEWYARLDEMEAELKEVNAALRAELDKKAEFERQLKASGSMKPERATKDELASWIEETAAARHAAFNRLSAMTQARRDIDAQQKGEIMAAQAKKLFGPEIAAEAELEKQAILNSRQEAHADYLRQAALFDAEALAQERAAALARGDDVAAIYEVNRERLESVRARLDAEVSIGAKSQVAAQIELRQETGKLGDELSESLLPRLRELITTAPDGATREKWRAMYAEINALQATGRQVGPFAGIKAGLDEYAKSTTDAFAAVKEAVGGAFKGMEDALTEFVVKGKVSFKDLTNSIISDMIRMQIQQSVTKPLAQMASMFFGVKGFAQGGAPGGTSAWRNQIVDRPTFFAFAKGGVMGEAGPEAIMPLTRGPDGNLGVRAHGTSESVVINQTFQIDATGADAGAVARVESAVRQMAANFKPMAQQAVREAMLRNRTSPAF